MKKNTILALCTALAVSCTAQEIQESRVTILGGHTGVDTKLSIGDPSTTEGVTTYKGLWSGSDAIAVFKASDGSALGKATLKDGAGSSYGTFTLPADTGGESVRVIYPSSASLEGTHVLEQSQSQETEGGSNMSSYAFAYSGECTQESGYQFSLTHALAYFRVKLALASQDEDYYGWKVQGVSLRVPGAALSGEYSVDLESGVLTAGKSVNESVSTTLDTPFTLGTEPSEIWFAALPSDLSGKLILLTLSLSDGTAVTPVTVRFTGKNLAAGTVNTLSVSNFTNILEPGDPSLPEYTTVSVKYYYGGTYYADTRTLDGMNRLDKMLVDTRDGWGGYKGVKPDSYISTNTEGYWRTGTWHGKKVFVDPDGNVALLSGLNCVAPEPNLDCSGQPNKNY